MLVSLTGVVVKSPTTHDLFLVRELSKRRKEIKYFAVPSERAEAAAYGVEQPGAGGRGVGRRGRVLGRRVRRGYLNRTRF